MKRISEYALLAEEELRKIDYKGGDVAGLYEPISYAMSAGGKRLRPVLTLMSAEAFCGDPMVALKAASGIEMFHNFTLLHDDVMDKSEVRRGRPTVHVKWDENTAILSGDTMLTLATQLISEVPDAVLRPVLDVFNRMAIDVYEGQQLDMSFEREENIEMSAYLKMIGLKTGALLGAASQIGALIGGATKEQSEEMYRFGMMLGLAFQIEDDYLDTFGDATTFGKPIGGDIKNGKKTFLVVSAMNRSDKDAEAYKIASKLPSGDTKVKTITAIFEKMNMRAECRKAVSHYSASALDALKKAGLDEGKREAFRSVVEKLTGRKK